MMDDKDEVWINLVNHLKCEQRRQSIKKYLERSKELKFLIEDFPNLPEKYKYLPITELTKESANFEDSKKILNVLLDCMQHCQTKEEKDCFQLDKQMTWKMDDQLKYALGFYEQDGWRLSDQSTFDDILVDLLLFQEQKFPEKITEKREVQEYNSLNNEQVPVEPEKTQEVEKTKDCFICKEKNIKKICRTCKERFFCEKCDKLFHGRSDRQEHVRTDFIVIPRIYYEKTFKKLKELDGLQIPGDRFPRLFATFPELRDSENVLVKRLIIEVAHKVLQFATNLIEEEFKFTLQGKVKLWQEEFMAVLDALIECEFAQEKAAQKIVELRKQRVTTFKKQFDTHVKHVRDSAVHKILCEGPIEHPDLLRKLLNHKIVKKVLGEDNKREFLSDSGIENEVRLRCAMAEFGFNEMQCDLLFKLLADDAIKKANVKLDFIVKAISERFGKDFEEIRHFVLPKETCGLCKIDFLDSEVTHFICGHCFCGKCLTEWLTFCVKGSPENWTCPECKKPSVVDKDYLDSLELIVEVHASDLMEKFCAKKEYFLQPKEKCETCKMTVLASGVLTLNCGDVFCGRCFSDWLTLCVEGGSPEHWWCPKCKKPSPVDENYLDSLEEILLGHASHLKTQFSKKKEYFLLPKDNCKTCKKVVLALEMVHLNCGDSLCSTCFSGWLTQCMSQSPKDWKCPQCIEPPRVDQDYLDSLELIMMEHASHLKETFCEKKEYFLLPKANCDSCTYEFVLSEMPCPTCGHIFCLKCFTKWLTACVREGFPENWKCPQCPQSAIVDKDYLDDLERIITNYVPQIETKFRVEKEYFLKPKTNCVVCKKDFPDSEDVRMAHLKCDHHLCGECCTKWLTDCTQKSPSTWKCPACKEPPIVDGDYLDSLEEIMRQFAHQLEMQFVEKRDNWSLVGDPQFVWCADKKCGSGLRAPEDRRKAFCTNCDSVTCVDCKKEWLPEHENCTCEEYEHFCLEQPNIGSFLEFLGIECPRCKTRHDVSRNSSLHFICNYCEHHFCSGCQMPATNVEDCELHNITNLKGTHAHHKRDCLYFLRNWDIIRLQSLIVEQRPEFLDRFSVSEAALSSPKRCGVKEYKTQNEYDMSKCGAKCISFGLCPEHYKEYLVAVVNHFDLDPLDSILRDEVVFYFQGGEFQDLYEGAQERDRYLRRTIEYLKDKSEMRKPMRRNP